MADIFDILREIERRPAMFVGFDDQHRRDQLMHLESMLHGYALALREHSVTEPGLDLLAKLGEYVRGRFGWSSSAGVVAAVTAAARTEEEAWALFWKLLWEFEATSGDGG